MFKVMNLVFGIGIAIILFLLTLLGIQAFYPEPQNAWETCDGERAIPVMKEEVLTEDQIQLEEEQKQREECYGRQEKLVDYYRYVVFVISVFIAILFLISSYFLLSHLHIAAGIASAGIILSFYAFITGWEASGPRTRFLVSLVLAIVIILFAYLTANKLKK